MVSLATRPGSAKRWLFLDIPADVRPAFGGKRRFAASTGETDLARAKVAAAKIEADWRRQIQDARDGVTRRQEDHERAAFELYDRLRNARTAEERAAITEEIVTKQGELLFTDRVGPGAPPPVSDRFRGLATGELVPVERNIEAYLASKAGSREAKPLRLRRAPRLGPLPPIKPRSSTARLQLPLDKSRGQRQCCSRGHAKYSTWRPMA